MKEIDKNNSQSFCCLCRNSGFKFYSNKLSRKNSFFSSAAKIDKHQIISKKLNLCYPKCKSQEIAVDFGKIINSTDSKNRRETSIDYNSDKIFEEQISISLIERIVDILSFATEKITKVNKSKNSIIKGPKKRYKFVK